MGMSIEKLITFCEEEEYNHRLNCKRYDDASGYTRSKDKNIRTTDAIREDTYAGFYKEISEIMRKYQKIKEIVSNNELEWGNTSVRANALLEVKKVVEDGDDTTNTGSN